MRSLSATQPPISSRRGPFGIGNNKNTGLGDNKWREANFTLYGLDDDDDDGDGDNNNNNSRSTRQQQVIINNKVQNEEPSIGKGAEEQQVENESDDGDANATLVDDAAAAAAARNKSVLDHSQQSNLKNKLLLNADLNNSGNKLATSEVERYHRFSRRDSLRQSFRAQPNATTTQQQQQQQLIFPNISSIDYDFDNSNDNNNNNSQQSIVHRLQNYENLINAHSAAASVQCAPPAITESRHDDGAPLDGNAEEDEVVVLSLPPPPAEFNDDGNSCFDNNNTSKTNALSPTRRAHAQQSPPPPPLPSQPPPPLFPTHLASNTTSVRSPQQQQHQRSSSLMRPPPLPLPLPPSPLQKAAATTTVKRLNVPSIAPPPSPPPPPPPPRQQQQQQQQTIVPAVKVPPPRPPPPQLRSIQQQVQQQQQQNEQQQQQQQQQQEPAARSFKLDHLLDINPKRLYVNRKFRCRIHDVIDERGHFWLEVIYSRDDELKFASIFKLFRLCARISEPCTQAAHVARGTRVAALYRDEWHRAVVLHPTSPGDGGKVRVRFVDLGIARLLDPLTEMRRIDDKFFNCPTKALKCSVSLDDDDDDDVNNDDHHSDARQRQWRMDRDARKFFTRLIYKKVLFAKVVGFSRPPATTTRTVHTSAPPPPPSPSPLNQADAINADNNNNNSVCRIVLGTQTQRGIIDAYMYTLSKFDRARYDAIKQRHLLLAHRKHHHHHHHHQQQQQLPPLPPPPPLPLPLPPSSFDALNLE